jgi:hypothetical protein
MGNIQPVGGRKPLESSPGFKESFQNAKNILIEKCKHAVDSGETGITISYMDLLVHNPNKDVYDDYLIDQQSLRKILDNVINMPYTVENNVIKTGDVIFYNMSSVKILFVFNFSKLSPLNEIITKHIKQKEDTGMKELDTNMIIEAIQLD